MDLLTTSRVTYVDRCSDPLNPVKDMCDPGIDPGVVAVRAAQKAPRGDPNQVVASVHIGDQGSTGITYELLIRALTKFK